MAREWIEGADADLRAAELLRSLTPPSPGIVAFHAQQAVEKSLKAYLVLRSIPFPRTHQIDLLMELCGSEVSENLETTRLLRMTKFAVTTRYPGAGPRATAEEADDACQIARAAVQVIELLISQEQKDS
ncbi:MAG: HEPN domain-containing protein [Phycisphaeraceae bacterium]|nr:HEPN domain-containing protein [Phycisphaeraceae bacterium]